MTRIGRIGADFLVWCGEKEPAWRQTGADDTDWADWRGFFGMVW